jgi:transposase
MALVIDADYSTRWLLPPSLEDLVPANHPARFIREFVDSLDLPELGLVDSPSLDGRPPYAKSLLLKVWLYGYFHGIRSTRKLERACREHLSLLWLTGMNQPDHNSLWRFWNAHKKQVRELYRQSVRVALKADLVSLALLAVDGTKIEAASSGRSGWSKEYMEKVLQQLDSVLAQREAAIEHNEHAEQGEYRLPESLSERQALKAAVQKGLAELRESSREHYHPVEPEAHRMKCNGINRFAFNAQAVADEKKGIIVACDVTDHEHDVGQLTLMLSQARELVQEVVAAAVNSDQPAVESQSKPQEPEVVALKAVADTGYGSGADIAQAKAAGFDVVAPIPEGKPKKDNAYHASVFIYDRQRDVCVCPEGKELTLQGSKDRRGTMVNIYRCRCKECPVRTRCTKDSKGRTIEIAGHHQEVVAMRAKLATAEGQDRYAQRARIIEPRFAEVKSNQGFRRWTVRGLQKVKAQWAWICMTANLHILFRSWAAGTLRFN